MEAADDIVGSLPIELSLEIFGHLNPRELGVCSRVCRRWNEITNSEALWRKYVPSYEKTVPLQYKTEVCDSKGLFSRYATTLKKWKKMKFREVTTPEAFGFVEIANGSFIAVVQPKKIEIIDLNNDQMKKAHEVEHKLPTVYMMQHFVTSVENDVLLVAGNFGEYQLAYRWTGSVLEFEDCIYGEQIKESVNLSSKSSNGLPDESSVLITFVPVIVVNNLIFLLGNQSIYCWSLLERRCVGRIDLEVPGLWFIVTAHEHRGIVYFCLREKLCAYDTRKHEIIQFLYFPTGRNIRDFMQIRLESNDSALLAVRSARVGGSQVFAWNMNYKTICEPFDVDTTCALHPRLPVVVYIKNTRDSFGNSCKLLVAEDLYNKSVIWSSSVYVSSSLSQNSQIIYGEEKIIRFSERHIGILYYLEHDPDWIYVWQCVNLESGKTSTIDGCIIPTGVFGELPDYSIAKKFIPSNCWSVKKLLVFT